LLICWHFTWFFLRPINMTCCLCLINTFIMKNCVVRQRTKKAAVITKKWNFHTIKEEFTVQHCFYFVEISFLSYFLTWVVLSRAKQFLSFCTLFVRRRPHTCVLLRFFKFSPFHKIWTLNLIFWLIYSVIGLSTKMSCLVDVTNCVHFFFKLKGEDFLQIGLMSEFYFYFK